MARMRSIAVALFTALRLRLTYANVAATLALFFSLSAGAYAFFKLPANSIHAKQLASKSVGTKELKDASILSTDVAKHVKNAPASSPNWCPPGQVVKAQLAGFGVRFTCVPDPNAADYAGGVAPCPEDGAIHGDTCLPVPGLPPEGNEEPPNGLPACAPDALPGTMCTEARAGELAQGSTAFGTIGNVGKLDANATYFAYASLTFEAPNYLDDGAILVDNFDDPTNKCIGNFQTPIAPEGFACIYLVRTADLVSAEGVSLSGVGSKNGFALKFTLDPTVTPVTGAEGSWAYTADAPDPD
jgi:hypothetical protein